MKRNNVEAELSQILLWYEQPEVLLLKSPEGTFTIAVRSGAEYAAPNAYVGATMELKMLQAYIDQKIDLRFVLSKPSFRRHWKFTFNPEDTSVILKRLSTTSEELRASLPDSGFFSRDHDKIEVVPSDTTYAVETLRIDGSWDFGEFSQLYSQIEDIYFILADAKRYTDPDTPVAQRTAIESVFKRPWDGGGSYLGFYKSVANDNYAHTPLRVGGVQYNSPGYIKVFAQQDNFSSLLEAVDHYGQNVADSKRAYRKLNTYLSVAGLKRKGGTHRLLTAGEKASVSEMTMSLAENIHGVDFETILKMSGKNLTMAAKVLSSIYRRIERLYAFFDKGRVSHDSIEVS